MTKANTSFTAFNESLTPVLDTWREKEEILWSLAQDVVELSDSTFSKQIRETYLSGDSISKSETLGLIYYISHTPSSARCVAIDSTANSVLWIRRAFLEKVMPNWAIDSLLSDF